MPTYAPALTPDTKARWPKHFYLVSVSSSPMMIALLFALIYLICNFVKFIFILGLLFDPVPFLCSESMSLVVCVCVRVCVPSKSIQCPYFSISISFIYLFTLVGIAVFDFVDVLVTKTLLKQEKWLLNTVVNRTFSWDED